MIGCIECRSEMALKIAESESDAKPLSRETQTECCGEYYWKIYLSVCLRKTKRDRKREFAEARPQ